jgi:hypothetical protein
MGDCSPQKNQGGPANGREDRRAKNRYCQQRDQRGGDEFFRSTANED